METVKRKLKFPNITNAERLKISLTLLELRVILCEKVSSFKEKYFKRFNEECTLYYQHTREIEKENKGIFIAETLLKPNLRKTAEGFGIKNASSKLRKKLNKEAHK